MACKLTFYTTKKHSSTTEYGYDTIRHTNAEPLTLAVRNTKKHSSTTEYGYDTIRHTNVEPLTLAFRTTTSRDAKMRRLGLLVPVSSNKTKINPARLVCSQNTAFYTTHRRTTFWRHLIHTFLRSTVCIALVLSLLFLPLVSSNLLRPMIRKSGEANRSEARGDEESPDQPLPRLPYLPIWLL